MTRPVTAPEHDSDGATSRARALAPRGMGAAAFQPPMRVIVGATVGRFAAA